VSSSSIIIHHHPSSSIIIHHHPSSSIIIQYIHSRAHRPNVGRTPTNTTGWVRVRARVRARVRVRAKATVSVEKGQPLRKLLPGLRLRLGLGLGKRSG